MSMPPNASAAVLHKPVRKLDIGNAAGAHDGFSARLRDFFRGGFGYVGIDVVDDHGRAVIRKKFRDALSDTAARPGDDRGFPYQ